MTTLVLSDLTPEERASLRRLPVHELFRIGPRGLEEISDATLDLRLSDEEQRMLARQVSPRGKP